MISMILDHSGLGTYLNQHLSCRLIKNLYTLLNFAKDIHLNLKTSIARPSPKLYKNHSLHVLVSAVESNYE